MRNLVVSEAAEIAGRGLTVFFERDPEPIPQSYQFDVQVTRPDGTTFQVRAFREFARKVPPGEVVAFVLPGVRKVDVPIGSCVAIIGPPAA